MFSALLLLAGLSQASDDLAIEVVRDDTGTWLAVGGEPWFVRGMNWGYMPIGQNYSYDFWGEDPEFIESALRYEMGLLSAQGVNTIRQYDVIPPEWVEWIYDNYGIRTAINPLVGRYGATINGVWRPDTDYSDPATRKTLIDMTMASVEKYKNTRGVLMYLLGNESNYGLHWSSFEIEALPKDEQWKAKAVYLYTLFGEITDQIHERHEGIPVAIVNGDLQYLDLIAEHAPNMDILGTNVYRGASARDLYEEVERVLGVPIVYTEFGADAYDAKAGREDHLVQARYVKEQWHEIYEQSAGHNGVGNAIGGMQFQWADGWWKFKQEENLDVHDTNASWPNGGYSEDFVQGENNMNEEWFGICAKGLPDANNRFELYPRAAYYVLRDAWTLDPYDAASTDERIDDHFDGIQPLAYDGLYKQSMAAGEAAALAKARVKNVRLDMRTYTTGDSARSDDRPRFDHLESYYADFEVRPTDTVMGHVELNVLGNVAENPIDETFYESRGQTQMITDDEGNEFNLAAANRVQVYRAGFEIEHKWFSATGYYREGHFHWGYEGDFFGLYPEAFYGPNPDFYNANVPIGVELAGKKQLSPFSLAFGPQIYWGANPTVIGKYYQTLGRWEVAVLHQEDFAEQADLSTTLAVPVRPTRRTTLNLARQFGPALVEWGGVFSGSDKLGETFTYVREARFKSYLQSGYNVLSDRIRWQDTLGTKLRLTVQEGYLNWYAQGVAKGLVAVTGVDPRQNFGMWTVKESGRGNQVSASTGVMVPVRAFSFGPHVLWQKPLIGPNPLIEGAVDPETGWFYPAILPRNVFSDPFAVNDNRESIIGELMIAYDPTPGSWMGQWDNNLREDAMLAAQLNIVYRHQPTSRDVSLGFNEFGIFAFPSAPPAQDVWEAKLRMVSAPRQKLRFIANGMVGTSQARGSDERLVRYSGGDLTTHIGPVTALGGAWFDYYGPFDFHRDFNLTYPLQLNGEVALRFGKPSLEVQPTRLGMLWKYRTRDEYSPPFTSGAPGDTGAEWEWRTFVEVTL